jgi:hypothetical protein
VVFSRRVADCQKIEFSHAFTAHSSQGRTLDCKIFIDIREMFDPSIFYTAISRSRKLSNIYIVSNSYARDQINAFNAETEVINLINEIFGECSSISDPHIDALNELIDGIEIPTTQPRDIKATTYDYMPLPLVRKTLAECNQSKFIIHSEYKYRHFLEFNNPSEFAQWSAAQPLNERCYHEVVTRDVRKLVIDIDGSSDLIKPLACVDILRGILKDWYDVTAPVSEFVIVDSCGLSALKAKHKESYQIRTRTLMTHRKTAKDIATACARLYKGAGTIDTGVYKKVQNFRMVGSTKYNDNRHSRTDPNAAGTYDALVSICDCADNFETEIYEPEPESEPVGCELAQKIIDAASEYTEGLVYAYKNNRHMFIRRSGSHCVLCDDHHDSDNMYVYRRDNVIYLRCWGAHHGNTSRVSEPVELFRD